MRYRKKPVEVEAMQIQLETTALVKGSIDPNSGSIAAISGWMLGNGFRGFRVDGDEAPFGIAIETLEGVMVASPGDFVIRGLQGEFYPCKPDIFEASYDPVDA